MVLGVKVSSQADKVTPKKKQTNRALYKNTNQVVMTESEGIQEIVNQATVQSVRPIMMVLCDADVRSKIAPIAGLREPQRQMHSRLALKKP